MHVRPWSATPPGRRFSKRRACAGDVGFVGLQNVQAVPAAERDWSRGATFAGMLDIMREIRERDSNCFGYRNYTQLPLAFMFLAATRCRTTVIVGNPCRSRNAFMMGMYA